jgi:hypothetical protein
LHCLVRHLVQVDVFKPLELAVPRVFAQWLLECWPLRPTSRLVEAPFGGPLRRLPLIVIAGLRCLPPASAAIFPVLPAAPASWMAVAVPSIPCHAANPRVKDKNGAVCRRGKIINVPCQTGAMGFLSRLSLKSRIAIALALALAFILAITGNLAMAAFFAIFIPFVALALFIRTGALLRTGQPNPPSWLFSMPMELVSSLLSFAPATPAAVPLPPEPGNLKGLVEYLLWKVKLFVILLYYPAAFFILLKSMGGQVCFLGLVYSIASWIAVIPHEFGHFVVLIAMGISPIGGARHSLIFIGTLSGTVFYTVPPLLLAAYYLFKKDAIATGAYLAFLAVALASMAAYVGTTSAEVDRYGGPDDLDKAGFHHDWYLMLSYLDSLESADWLSSIFQNAAVATAAVSFAFLAAWAFLNAKAALGKYAGPLPPPSVAK